MRIGSWIGAAAALLATLAPGTASAQNGCGALIEASCLQSLGAGAAPLAGGDCADQFTAYRACLANAATAAPLTARPLCSETRAQSLWADAKAANNCFAYEAFREACPGTPEARFAEAALRTLECAPPVRSAVVPASIEPETQTRASAETPDPAPATPAAETPPAAGASFRDCAACPEMLAIPAGRFKMGAPRGEPRRAWNEGPRRLVRIEPFALGKYEVTFAEWDACVADGGCRGRRPEDAGWGRGERPVINVSWKDAQTYIAWLNGKTAGAPYRLPSEAEWEYAARAGAQTPFWWGREITAAQANYDSSFVYDGGGSAGPARQRTAPVDSFAPNAFGLHQVHGNVWEWVQDCWNDTYRGAPKNGAARTSGECYIAGLRRGGAWNSNPKRLRSAARDVIRRQERRDDTGFRVAKTLSP